MSGVVADAGGVLGEGGVAHVVASVLNAPMRANPFVPARGRLVDGRGYPVDDFVRKGAKACGGVALIDRALQAQHSLDQRLPGRMSKPGLSRKGSQLAGFPAIAAFDLGRIRADRSSRRGCEFKPAAQVGLIVLDLGEQMIS